MQISHTLLGLVAATAASVSLSAQGEFPIKDSSPERMHHESWLAGAVRAQANSSAWQAFVAQQGDGWMAHWTPATGTPRAIFGPGLPLEDWRENSLVEARRHATALLAERSELLGLGTSEFRESIGSRIGRQWSFVYDQYFRGLPVIGGRADVRVHMAGKVSMFGASVWPIPADFDTTPTVEETTAVALAWQALGIVPNGVPQPGVVAAPRLVVWGDINATELAPFYLAWEVAVSNVDKNGQGPIGRQYVDARTGRALGYTSDKHECGLRGCTTDNHGSLAKLANGNEPIGPAALPVATTVTVMGWTRVGLDGYGPLTNVPMPGLEISVPGVGNFVTDANGQFVANIGAPVTVSVGQLDGRHHAVIQGTDAPADSVLVLPGVPTTLQILGPAATVAQGSHTTTSYWVDAVNQYARGILGNSPELAVADAVVPTVNIANTCNAFYTSNTINFYSAGGGCSNTANATVVAHEWGHGLDHRYGGISQTNGLSEGWGDILGMYLVDSPDLGLGFQTAGVPLRSGNNTRQYPTGSGVHAQGESWMGFAWKLRDRLATTYSSRPYAIAVTNDIVVGTIAANAADQQGAVLEVFLADDNDANLNNGTPHSGDLIWACQQHSLPTPTGTTGLPANDECAFAINLVQGVQGPFHNVGATTSFPWPCALGGRDVWFRYPAAAAGQLTVSTCGQSGFDTAIEFFSGNCGALVSLGCLDDSCGLQTSLSLPVPAGVIYVRVGGFNSNQGLFSLDVVGPPLGTFATVENYGEGCYRTATSFYELMTSANFDLSGQAMRLARVPSGYFASFGGAFIPPTPAATVLTLSDDSQTVVNLNGTFNHPSGSATTLNVCSNGFVSAGGSNGTGFTPSVAAWVASAFPRWGTWHDFNPAASGSGSVKFEQLGNLAIVTWDGVYSFNQTQPNLWQIQFDLATGDVTTVWQNVTSTGNSWLVGYTAATSQIDPGNSDLSTRLVQGFLTGSSGLPMTLSATAPAIGTPLVMTATNYPLGTVFGFHILSLQQFNPGIDLTSIGMPGCLRFTGLEAVNLRFVANGQTSYTMNLPNTSAYVGLPLTSQAWGVVNGFNQLGMVNSNGVRMVVGF